MAKQGEHGISWTDTTWSPLRVRVKRNAGEIAKDKGYTSLVEIAEKMAGRVGPHCEHVSSACDNCYAENYNHRCLPANGTGLPYDRRSRDLVDSLVDEKILLQPMRWRDVSCACSRCRLDHTILNCPEKITRPRRIFVENQSDIFGDWYTDEQIDQVFAVMSLCPQHIFQVLTKRPVRMLEYILSRSSMIADLQTYMKSSLAEASRHVARLERSPLPGNAPLSLLYNGWPLKNLWLGVTAEDQEQANKRIPLLLQTPAAVRIISAEPLVKRLDLTSINLGNGCSLNALTGEVTSCHPLGGSLAEGNSYARINQVITGGESGLGARASHPDWFRLLRDHCQQYKTPFHFKQWGEWAPRPFGESTHMIRSDNGHVFPEPRQEEQCNGVPGVVWRGIARVTKHKAGCQLDGRKWKQFPEI